MNMPCGHDESNRDITVETRTVICRMCDLDDRRRDAEGREKELCAELAALRQRVAELTAQLPDGMKHCTIRFKSCPVGHGELTATNWVQHDCQVCQIRKLESTVSTLTAERDADREQLAESVALLKTHGSHRNNCNAFPATSAEQIAHDCDCGLSPFLTRSGGG